MLLGLYAKIKSWKKEIKYRFLINPETIGSICFLNKYKKNIKKKIIGGLVLTCLGGPKKKYLLKKLEKIIRNYSNFLNTLKIKTM